MGLQTNVTRRGRSPVYYVRVTLPAPLLRARRAAGLPVRKEVWKSLHTKDAAEARRRGPHAREQLLAEFERELDHLLTHDPAEIPFEPRKRYRPSNAEIEQMIWNLLRVDLRDDQFVRDAQPTADRRRELQQQIADRARDIRASEPDPKVAALRAAVDTIDDQLELSRVDLRAEQHAIELQAIKSEHPVDVFGGIADAIIADEGWDILPGSPQYALMCNLLKSGRLRALRAFAARDAGEYLGSEANPLRDAPQGAVVAPIAKARAKRGETLVDLLDIYLKEQEAGLSSEEIDKKKQVVSLLSEHVGPTTPVRSIGRATFRTFKQALAHWPKAAKTMKQFRGKSFKQIVDLNQRLKAKTIAASTINNYISSLGAFFTWLHAHDYHDEPHITHGMLLKVDKAAKARRSFTDDELQTIFSQPLFIGAASDELPREPGTVLIADWRFWIPLVCLYTGARLGEIAQLRTADIQHHATRLFLHVTDVGEDMSVKTKDSVRTVPVHDDLLRLGFGEYVKRRVDAADARLWPELVLGRHGRFSEQVSKWWRNHLQAIGLKGNAYMFRHTFIDALRRAGHLNAEIAPIVGHSSDSTTNRYGVVPEVTLRRRSEMVNEIVFPMIATVPSRT